MFGLHERGKPEIPSQTTEYMFQATVHLFERIYLPITFHSHVKNTSAAHMLHIVTRIGALKIANFASHRNTAILHIPFSSINLFLCVSG